MRSLIGLEDECDIAFRIEKDARAIMGQALATS
jgi:hypothetical protein